MKKADNDAKIVMGAVVGGLIGICTLTLILSLRKHKDTNLGTAISHLGGLFEKSEGDETSKKSKTKESTLLEIADWLISGMNLWKKFHG